MPSSGREREERQQRDNVKQIERRQRGGEERPTKQTSLKRLIFKEQSDLNLEERTSLMVGVLFHNTLFKKEGALCFILLTADRK